MNLQKTPVALAAISLFAALPAAAQTAITMEAEGMARSSYVVDGSIIKLATWSSPGTATQRFGGASGTYDVEVHVVAESDGQSTLEVSKGSTLLHKYTYPLGNGGTSFTIGKVALTKGETIKLVGRYDKGSMARVDKVVFKPVAVSTPTVPAPTGAVTLEAESMSRSSTTIVEGNLLRLASWNTPGSAWQSFNGESGNYDIRVDVLSEPDGQPTLEVFKGATQLRRHTYAQGDGITSFTIGNVAVAKGETLKLTGYQDQGASARVDKVVLTPVAATTPSQPEPPSGTLTMEAEGMARSTTVVVEGDLVKLAKWGTPGSAWQGFGAASGIYDMKVHILAEPDGQPTLEVYKGSTQLRRHTYPLGNGLTSFTISGVALAKGETIKLTGYQGGGASARVDKVEFRPSSTTPTTPPPDSGDSSSPSDPGTSTACANPAGGYEGFGRNTTGGAGKTIYRVKNLNDSGAGSLRDALSQGNRCVVFDVGGTITLSGNLMVTGANVTIDGFTAPSPGITLRRRTLVVQGSSGASNVVVRGIRHRGTDAGMDGIRVYNSSNVVFDRVSVSGFGDGAIDVTENSRDVTIQWSILGNGNPEHNFPNLIGYKTSRVTVHHNLYVNGDYRNPYCGRNDGLKRFPSEITCDVRNNLIWNYGGHGTAVMDYGMANIVNNYYYTSKPSSASNTISIGYIGEAGAYVSGNHSKNGWNVNANGNRSTPYSATAPKTTDALTAAKDVVAKAGARGPRFGLDTADRGYVGSITLTQ